jgi:hypothetical protein
VILITYFIKLIGLQNVLNICWYCLVAQIGKTNLQMRNIVTKMLFLTTRYITLTFFKFLVKNKKKSNEIA